MNDVPSVLLRIKGRKVGEVEALYTSGSAGNYKSCAKDCPPTKDFAGAVSGNGYCSKLIAEYKRASPSIFCELAFELSSLRIADPMFFGCTLIKPFLVNPSAPHLSLVLLGEYPITHRDLKDLYIGVINDCPYKFPFTYHIVCIACYS